MTLNLSVDELLTTTRSVRKRLDLEKPVSREILMECLELALQAPTGSNRQTWQWVFVDDPDQKRDLAAIYYANYLTYRDIAMPEFPEGDPRAAQAPRLSASGAHLAEHLQDVPCLLVPCIEGRVEQTPELASMFWGSLLPAVWSFMLALRSRGLGSSWTSLHLVDGGEQKAAEVLGIPFDGYTQGGLFPIAYTKGTDFRPAQRLPAEQFVHWNNW